VHWASCLASRRWPTTSGDPVALAKAISKYAKDNPDLPSRQAWFEGA